MADETHIQASFSSGEWNPLLYARVDVAKYKTGAATMLNFYVDYRGGASSRMGLKWVNQAWNYTNRVRMVRFQVTTTVGYALEFGHLYIRFHFQGAPVLETAFAITGATQANPCVITVPGHNFVAGQTIFISGVAGMTPLNNRFFNVSAVAGAAVTLTTLTGVNINSTGYPAYTSGGTAARVFTIASPYTGSELFQLKFSQNADQLIICHPNHTTYQLFEVAPTNWSLQPITFGTTLPGVTIGSFSTNLAAGTVNYAYAVSAIDGSGQEGPIGPIFNIPALQDLRVTNGTIQLNWSGLSGAVAYNIYKTTVSYTGVVPAGLQFGFIGQTTGGSFIDSNIAPSFAVSPQVTQNPFAGAGIAAVNITTTGTYTAVPSASAIGASIIPAVLQPVLSINTVPTIVAGGTGYAPGDTVFFPNFVALGVATVGAGGAVTGFSNIFYPPTNGGSITSGSTPANPVASTSTTGAGSGLTVNLSWGVGIVNVLNPGIYQATPSVTFSPAGAAATAVLGNSNGSNPTVPGFFQQRLLLAAPSASPDTFFLSQTGNYFNFNKSSPVRGSDAIQGTLVSGVLNTIKSVISTTAGMLILTDNAHWIVNGGTAGTAVTPSAITATAQSYAGANDIPPIVANYDVLYVGEKGSSVRDLAFNIYFNVFTGTEISILSSHLLFGFQIVDWAWAEEPFKIVWMARSDGAFLSLTFLKEQDFIGWAQHSTPVSNVESICVVTEQVGNVFVDAVYMAVLRPVTGGTARQIERMADRINLTVTNAICVDSAQTYSGPAATTFYGAEHLGGLFVTGLADGVVIPTFLMPTNGQFTLGTAAQNVIIGLSYTPTLTTLPLDTGALPTMQGVPKAIPEVVIRVNQTLGLSMGSSSSTALPLKDLVQGNVSSMLTGQPSQVVSGLFSGDARLILDPTYTVPGQYTIVQNQPYPASVLGVIPQFARGK